MVIGAKLAKFYREMGIKMGKEIGKEMGLAIGK